MGAMVMHERFQDLRRGHLTVGGVRTPLIEAGPGDSPEAVLFVHGNPGSSSDWADLLARSGEFTRAVAFDMPGFGRSDKPEGFDYSIPGYAGFIQATLEELGIDRVHLVLHDTGGWFGQEWAGQHPDAFASAVLVNTPPGRDYRWYPLARAWRTRGLGELMHATLTRPFFDFNVNLGAPRRMPRAFVDRMWRDYDRGTQRAVLRLYRATDARHLVTMPPEFFAALDRPALVVWGESDMYIPRRFAEMHRRAFPSVRVVVLDGCGHWPFVDDPKAVADHVIPFLRERVGAGVP
jgi:pimeloyl-ACP methyl ester carboxylesterase